MIRAKVNGPGGLSSIARRVAGSLSSLQELSLARKHCASGSLGRRECSVGPVYNACGRTGPIRYMFRHYSSQVDVVEALRPELDALEMHSSLLNQTTPRQLLALADVIPMMKIFRSLDVRGAGRLGAPKVLRALKQTAKDASFALRGLPQTQRVQEQSRLFASLRAALDEVASSHDSLSDPASLRLLLGTYEIVDPGAGVDVYNGLPSSLQGNAGGAVIPCMVKTRQPFSDVRQAFERESQPDARTAATMAWACLRYGEIDAAQVLFGDIINASPPPAVLGFLLDAFVGDAPAALARQIFNAYGSHTPHHAAMTRLLIRCWNTDNNVDTQLDLFRSYLARIAVPSELGIKTVATTVVRNVVAGSASPHAMLDHIGDLCHVYDEFVAEHTVFLNTILSQVAERWSARDEARDAVLAVLHNYGPQDNTSAVSFRVRLNALERLTGTEALEQELWAARISLPALPPVQKLDWLALARATNASDWFVDQWRSAGSPFERDVYRFCASRGYRIQK